MFIWLLISVLCFWTLWRFTRSIEIREYGEWKPFSAPLWMWAIAIIICFIPIINVIFLITVITLFIVESRDTITDVRFNNNNMINNIVSKIINILNKEY